MVTWNDIKIADEGFLINLKDREDRLVQSLDEFEKNNIKGVERFDAIKITEDSDQGWVIRGCTHSHMEILRMQVDLNRNLTNEMLGGIYPTDFDLLFLGACLLEPAELVSNNLIKPNKFVQTTAYLSSLKFAEYVVNNFNYLDKDLVVYGEQIDSYYSVLALKKHWKMDNCVKGVKEILEHNLRIYFHYPQLFNQRASYSNILNKMSDYSYMNRLRNMKNFPTEN